jgi:hypothetical protein
MKFSTCEESSSDTSHDTAPVEWNVVIKIPKFFQFYSNFAPTGKGKFVHVFN